MTDIVARLRTDELPGERQYQREARIVLRGLLDEAAGEIERLRAEVERLCRSRNRWGKKYNDCLASLRLAVFSDTEYVKEIETRAEAAERKVKVLREALDEAIEGWEDGASYKGDYLREKHGDAEGIAKARDALKETEANE